MVLCILIFTFLNRKWEDKRFCIKWWHTFPHINLHLISSWMECWFLRFVPKYFNCSIIQSI
jgi:hypothetical protein